MKRGLLNQLGGRGRAFVMTLAVIALPATPVVSLAESPADRFIASLAERSTLAPEAARVIRTAWDECGTDCDQGELLIQGLTLTSSRFRDGLDDYDSDKYVEAAEVMASLRADGDPFVASNATAFEVKAMVQSDRLLEAFEAIQRATADGGVMLSTYSYFAPEIDFLKGYCLLADVQYKEAIEALSTFLTKHPEASQRLVISAQQMLLELRGREPEKIGDVADLMTFCGRRLVLADAGEKVQSRQDRIVELLDQMIEEAEQNEKNSQSGGSSGSGGSNSQSPQNPMQESTLPGGSGSDSGEMGASRRAKPAEMWGAMPPAERERVLQALRDSFPQQYRRLVEQYYEELAKQP